MQSKGTVIRSFLVFLSCISLGYVWGSYKSRRLLNGYFSTYIVNLGVAIGGFFPLAVTLHLVDLSIGCLGIVFMF
jgi:hypothetical protein